MTSMTSDFNKPMTISGAGLSGPRPKISPREANKRKGLAIALMSNGVPDAEVVQTLRKEFGITTREAKNLRFAALKKLTLESELKRPHKKALAEHRIQRHIVQAASRHAWGAVAQLEKNLSKIQGTEEPTEQRVTVDARLQQAVLVVLGSKTPEEIQSLVAEEVSMLGST